MIAALIAWAQAHAAALSAVALIAGTAAQVESAAVNADELARRVERRIEEQAPTPPPPQGVEAAAGSPG